MGMGWPEKHQTILKSGCPDRLLDRGGDVYGNLGRQVDVEMCR